MIGLVEQYIPSRSIFIVEFLIQFLPIFLFSIPLLVLIYYLIYTLIKRHRNNINNYWNHDNRQD